MGFGDNAPYPQLSGPFSLRSQFMGQPARAYAGASQILLPAFANNTIKLDTIAFDPYASSFNLGSNAFVPPATGYYHIHCGFSLIGTITALTAEIQKNGAEVSRVYQYAGPAGSLTSAAIAFQGGDIVFGTPADNFSLYVTLTGATSSITGLATRGTFMSVQQLA